MTARLQFWFEFASPYSYLAAHRIEALAGAYDICVEWRPFLLGAIFKKDLGYTDSPFNRHPKKFNYLWHDIRRQSRLRNMPDIVVPDPFPQSGLLPARIACFLAQSGHVAHFANAIYQAHFQNGMSLTDAQQIKQIVREIGLDPDAVFEGASSDQNKTILKQLTDEADQRGLFGAPFFITSDGEQFWGDDRLEVALNWEQKLSTDY